MASKPAEFELSKHYKGVATLKFYPKAHYYVVDDPEYVDPKTGKIKPLVKQQLGGATSLTGVMDKGMGLMLYPMYESSKFLRNYFATTTVKEMIDNPETVNDLLKLANSAHTNKSDRGKSVGTDAHAWVQLYLEALRDWQELPDDEDLEFVAPEIPTVEEIATVLRRSYITIINALKPKSFEEYGQLPKLIFRDLEIQQAIWIEADMIRKATSAAKAWFELHEITVHGVEANIYSRTLLSAGKYDADLSVLCTKKCNWCYRNGNATLPEEDFFGRYITDFKSTNASTNAPKGIYPEALAQCGVYDVGVTDEFPDIVYDGHLILNGSKNEEKTDKGGNKLPVFSTHFSFERQRNRREAILLAELKELIRSAKLEVEASA